MGYTTEFLGQIEITPPLSQEEINFLEKFSETRRMNRHNGPYYVDNAGDFGQDREDDIIDYNTPPQGQPSLWCNWIPTENGKYIEWNGAEKFYSSSQWMQYIIDHFIGETPLAQKELPFLVGHTCNGTITAQGEEIHDRWLLVVENNKVTTKALV